MNLFGTPQVVFPSHHGTVRSDYLGKCLMRAPGEEVLCVEENTQYRELDSLSEGGRAPAATNNATLSRLSPPLCPAGQGKGWVGSNRVTRGMSPQRKRCCPNGAPQMLPKWSLFDVLCEK